MIGHRSISFFTNCYEGDWKSVLIYGQLEAAITSCQYKFDFKGLIINNVKDRKLVSQYASKAIENKLIDAYFFSEDDSIEILGSVNIKRQSFKLDLFDGYWYSMGPLAAIYHIKSDYLLYFTCDCKMNENQSSAWIDEGIDLLKDRSDIAVVSPLWDYVKAGVVMRPIENRDGWFFIEGFSDQVFLVETRRFKGSIYNDYHPSNDSFPVYGGNPFERRVNGYLRSANLLRAVNCSVTYNHVKLPSDNEVSKDSMFIQIKKRTAICLRMVNRRIRFFKWKINLI